MAKQKHPINKNIDEILQKYFKTTFTNNPNIHRNSPIPHIFILCMSKQKPDDIMYYQSFNYVTHKKLSLMLHLYVGIKDSNNIMPSIKIVPQLQWIRKTNQPLPKNNGGFKTITANSITILKAIQLANVKLNQQIKTNPYFKP